MPSQYCYMIHTCTVYYKVDTICTVGNVMESKISLWQKKQGITPTAQGNRDTLAKMMFPNWEVNAHRRHSRKECWRVMGHRFAIGHACDFVRVKPILLDLEAETKAPMGNNKSHLFDLKCINY